MSYCIVPRAWQESYKWSCHGDDNDSDKDDDDDGDSDAT